MAGRSSREDLTLSDGAAPSVGKLFANRYRIEALIGRGGMGSVYRAHDREVDELVALKTLDIYAADDQAVERFRREVRLARRVTHRNVARTYDLGEHGGLRFLTMEFVDGQNLRKWIAERPHPLAALEVGVQIAQGLEAAHEAGIVHRDLKPSNIMIEGGGRVVITDFGIAKSAHGHAGIQSGGLLGTPAYMAPEQVNGQPSDARTDIYAVGLLLVEMLTGRLPFSGDNPVALATARLLVECPDLDAHEGVPAPLREVLERCLQRDPAGRYATVAQLAAVLEELREDIAGTTLGPGAWPGEGQRSSTPDALPTETSLSGGLTAGSGPLDRFSTTGSRSRSTAGPRTNAKALAVLPFRYRGPADSDFISDALLDALTDILSMTRGLRVSGAGTTARVAASGNRDPRSVGRELGVDVIVDGTIQLAGKRLRISARLLDVDSGFQLWSERFEGALEDVFELQDKMGMRIAEALRVELEVLDHGGLTEVHAVESYLRARQAKLHWRLRGEAGAVRYYQTVLEHAPDFKPALAGHAVACMRAWFLPNEGGDELDWAEVSRQAVEQAMALAPEYAETQCAAATWAVQQGDYRAAAERLHEALRIAPTCALAHEYLGRLQIEAGRPERGLSHLELALDLDPAFDWCMIDIARHKALHGDLTGYRETMDRLLARTDTPHASAQLMEMRVGAWTRDLEQIRRSLAKIDPDSPDEGARTIRTYGLPLVSPYDAEALERTHEMLATLSSNNRTRTMLHQLGAEQTAFHGDRERALAHLRRAVDLVLIDLNWLDHCPLFDDLRHDPRFVELRAKLVVRCEPVWGAR